jgi:dGTPase
MMNWEQLLTGKRVGEAHKGEDTDARTAFERDYDRIIFSHPFRRLQDKTQVHPLPEHDFVHTRLTHSLEVSSVGRSLGRKVGEVLMQRHPSLQAKFTAFDFGAVVAAAALAHDLGNPPFGHSGEKAISEYFSTSTAGGFFSDKVSEKEWADLTQFEGNAQGFRLLNKRHYQGLKLTYATLGAFSKYPRESLLPQRDKARRSQKKYGYFQSEKEIFQETAEALGLLVPSPGIQGVWVRHPLTFLVEAADDICYHIIDLEDGVRLGLVPFSEALELLAPILGDRLQPEKLRQIPGVDEQIGLLRALTIGVLIDQCTELFLDNEQAILSGTFDRSLADDISVSNSLQEIIRVSIEKIYRSRIVLETEAAGFEVLPGLMQEFTYSAYHHYLEKNGALAKHQSLVRLIPPYLTAGWDQAPPSTYEVLMACIDFVSGMTDTHAINLFRKIKGISLARY